MSSEVCEFELDCGRTPDELEKCLQGIGMKLHINEVSQSHRAVTAHARGTKRFSIGICNYENALNAKTMKEAQHEMVPRIVAIARALLEIADGEVYYYRNAVAGKYDEVNTHAITAEQIAEYYPFFDDGWEWRYLLQASHRK